MRFHLHFQHLDYTGMLGRGNSSEKEHMTGYSEPNFSKESRMVIDWPASHSYIIRLFVDMMGIQTTQGGKKAREIHLTLNMQVELSWPGCADALMTNQHISESLGMR